MLGRSKAACGLWCDGAQLVAPARSQSRATASQAWRRRRARRRKTLWAAAVSSKENRRGGSLAERGSDVEVRKPQCRRTDCDDDYEVTTATAMRTKGGYHNEAKPEGIHNCIQNDYKYVHELVLVSPS